MFGFLQMWVCMLVCLCTYVCACKGVSIYDNLKIMVIEVIPRSVRGGDRLRQLLQRETFWIVTLKATTFPGLNDDVDFSPFL